MHCKAYCTCFCEKKPPFIEVLLAIRGKQLTLCGKRQTKADSNKAEQQSQLTFPLEKQGCPPRGVFTVTEGKLSVSGSIFINPTELGSEGKLVYLDLVSQRHCTLRQEKMLLTCNFKSDLSFSLTKYT